MQAQPWSGVLVGALGPRAPQALRAAALRLVTPSQDYEIARQIFKDLNYFLNISFITTKWSMEVILLVKTLFRLLVWGILKTYSFIEARIIFLCYLCFRHPFPLLL